MGVFQNVGWHVLVGDKVILSASQAQLYTLALRLDVSWPAAAHTAQHSAESPLHPKSLD
jgi:hypothetical protein